MPKLTKRFVDGLRPDPGGRDVFYWDAGDGALKGFGIRIKPSGAASYMVQYRNKEGRTRRLVVGKVGTLTPAEARTLAGDALRAAAKGEDPSAERKAVRGAITVSALCDMYLAYAKDHIKASTLAMDRSRIETHVKPLIGRLTVRSLTAADIERLKADIIVGKTAKARQAGRGGVAKGGPGVAARTVGMIGTMLEHARRSLKIIKDNPARDVKKPKDGRQQRFLALNEISMLGETMRIAEAEGENPTALAAIRLLLLTGMRRMEVLALRRAWIDLRGHCIRFEDTKSGAQLRPIGAEAINLIEAQPARENCSWLFPAAQGDGHFVGLPRVLDRMCAKAGLAGVTVHVLRHTFAATAAEMGFSEITIAGLLGHSVRGVTARYAHVPDSALVAAADQISTRIGTALAGDADVAPCDMVQREPFSEEITFISKPALPPWRDSPWRVAIEELAFGKVETVANLLERGEPLPKELGEVLAIALRGGVGLPFRLGLIANPRPGARRSGRWPKRETMRDMMLAVKLADQMKAGSSYDEAARLVADENCIGDRTVRAAYSRWKAEVPEITSWGAETREIMTKMERRKPPPHQPVAKWMLKGSS